MTDRQSTPIFVRVLFLVVLAFTALGVIESGFMLYDVWTKGSLSAQRAPDLSFGIRSWTVHHAMRPGFQSPNISTNSFGLRSPEVSVPKPRGTFRILLLGDSFTFGLRVGADEVFARRLEQQLRARFPSVPVEVVNAGVISYCPLLEYLQYRHHLHSLDPDLVVLNFDMSDVQDHLAYARDLVRDSSGHSDAEPADVRMAGPSDSRSPGPCAVDARRRAVRPRSGSLPVGARSGSADGA